MTTEGLDGRIALVTGGGSGIGEACVKRLAELGAIVNMSSIFGAGARDNYPAYVASKQASFVTGGLYAVDGGLTAGVVTGAGTR